MQFLLICQRESGCIAFPVEMIGKVKAPERCYTIRDGQILVSGYPDVVLHDDVQKLLKNALFRMPTPIEQEAWIKTQQGEIQESINPPAVLEDINQQNSWGQEIAPGVFTRSGG